jgi:hypothetical protein
MRQWQNPFEDLKSRVLNRREKNRGDGKGKKVDVMTPRVTKATPRRRYVD